MEKLFTSSLLPINILVLFAAIIFTIVFIENAVYAIQHKKDFRQTVNLSSVIMSVLWVIFYILQQCIQRL